MANSRQSAFRGTWTANARPYVTLVPDCWISIQSETNLIGCGECKRSIDLNRYVTSINTENYVDSPPGSASIQLSVPDTDVNNFYSDGRLVIQSMMEVEIFAKGYYLVGGVPQYYRIFWGLISSVTQSWSGGVTTINIACKDMLRWWELTVTNLNPAFIGWHGSQVGYQLFQNRFAGFNPYTVIIQLAKEAMGDFLVSTGSFQSFIPDAGRAEGGVFATYSQDIMAYWQLKFSSIWQNLVLFGTSGFAYTVKDQFNKDLSAQEISNRIFDAEDRRLNLNQETAKFRIKPEEQAAYKIQIDRAGDVEFFQNDFQTKLQLATTARDQAGGFEFYCDSTGDIIFKPPFYNVNVIPNKPVSWIQDFEIIDDSITESEAEVYTHIDSSGNAFGGVIDYGLNDPITTPRTGVTDYHLLRRYGWRRLDYQTEWAGNAKKLFYFLLDWMDRQNSRRESGNITIPLRPELRIGFPVWIPKYDSFFYVQGLSHTYSVGGQATTVLTLTAKRSKFIAPKNIGQIIATDEIKKAQKTKARSRELQQKEEREAREAAAAAQKFKGKAFVPQGRDQPESEPIYEVSFPTGVGETSIFVPDAESKGPAILRDPDTGKLLGYPNVVMVYRSTLNALTLAKVKQNIGTNAKPEFTDSQRNRYRTNLLSVNELLRVENREKLVARLRAHRYEAGLTSGGLYDYAHDVNAHFKEFSVIPINSIIWGTGSDRAGRTRNAVNTDVTNSVLSIDEQQEREDNRVRQEQNRDRIKIVTKDIDETIKAIKAKKAEIDKVTRELNDFNKKVPTDPRVLISLNTNPSDLDELNNLIKLRADAASELAEVNFKIQLNNKNLKSKLNNDLQKAALELDAISLANNQKSLKTRISDLDVAIKSKQSSSSIITQRDVITNKLLSLQNELEVLQNELNAKREELVDLQSGLVSPDLASATAAVTEAKIKVQDLQFKIGDLEVQIKNLSAKDPSRAQIQADLNKARQDLIKANNDLQGKKQKFNNAAAQKVKPLNQILGGGEGLSVMVRPVSDEFGFEVIGHYRYGRGVLIDRNNLTFPTDDRGTIANRLQIQFSPTGGLTTDPPQFISGRANAVNAVSRFEQLQPDDYRTGATFKGFAEPGDKITDIHVTSKRTYDSYVRRNPESRKFSEVDATTRAVTLYDMQPNLSRLGDAFQDCACGLGKADWLSILPRESVDQILRSSSTGDGTVAAGEITTEGFFTLLDNFLIENYAKVYQDHNAIREQKDVAGLNPVSQPPLFSDPSVDGRILPTPSSSLFQRAALGDPEALNALKREANNQFDMAGKDLRKIDEFTKDPETVKTFQGIGPNLRAGLIGLEPGILTANIIQKEGNQVLDSGVERFLAPGVTVTTEPPKEGDLEGTSFGQEPQPQPGVPVNIISAILNPKKLPDPDTYDEFLGNPGTGTGV